MISFFTQLAKSSLPFLLYIRQGIRETGDSIFSKYTVLTQIRPFHQEHSDHCLFYLPFRD